MKNVFLVVASFFVLQMVSLSTFGMEESSDFSRFRADRKIASVQISSLHMNAQLLDAELRKRIVFMNLEGESQEEVDSKRFLLPLYQKVCDDLQEIIKEFGQLRSENECLLEMDLSSYTSKMAELRGNPSTSPWKTLDLMQAKLTQRYVHLQSQHQLTEYEEASEQLRRTQKELLDTKVRLIEALEREQALRAAEASKQPRDLSVSLQTSARAGSSASDVSLFLSRRVDHEVQFSGACAAPSRDHSSFGIVGFEYADPEKPLVMDMFFYFLRKRGLFQQRGAASDSTFPKSDEASKIIRDELAINQRLLLCINKIFTNLTAKPDGSLVYKASKNPAELKVLTIVLDFYRRFFAIRTNFLETLLSSKSIPSCSFFKFDKSPEENAEIKRIADMLGNLIELLNDIHAHYMEVSVPVDAQISYEEVRRKILGTAHGGDSLVDADFKAFLSRAVLSEYGRGLFNTSKENLQRTLQSTLKDPSHEEIRKYLPSEYLEPLEYIRALQQELLTQTTVGKASFSRFFEKV